MGREEVVRSSVDLGTCAERKSTFRNIYWDCAADAVAEHLPLLTVTDPCVSLKSSSSFLRICMKASIMWVIFVFLLCLHDADSPTVMMEFTGAGLKLCPNPHHLPSTPQFYWHLGRNCCTILSLFVIERNNAVQDRGAAQSKADITTGVRGITIGKIKWSFRTKRTNITSFNAHRYSLYAKLLEI